MGTFAAVVIGLFGLDVVVICALRPDIAELTSAGDDHARAVEVAVRLRGQLAAAHRNLRSSAPSSRSLDQLRAVSARDGWVRATQQLAALAGTEREKELVSTLETTLSEWTAQPAGPDVNGGAARERWGEALARATDAAGELGALNAREVTHATTQVQRSLRLLVVAVSALTVFVVAGALVLLRGALRARAAQSALLDEHVKDLEDFAARAAHELRTPLQAIVLAVSAARQGRVDALPRVERGVARLAETIDATLELSKRGGSVAGARAPVLEVGREVSEELAARTAATGIRLGNEIEPALVVAMAPAHLRIVLSNLVGNAIKYTAGTQDGRVTVRGAAVQRRAEIVVSDNGPGIPRDALPHVFDPFFRATDRGEGYGLGLATVKRLVEMASGNVRITSEQGRGTSVTIQLPLASAGGVSPHSRSTGPSGSEDSLFG